jgi:hypothetical protein
MRVITGLVLLFAASIGVANAQQKPDFSGHWVMASPPDGVGQEQVVTQNATTVTVAPAAGGAGPTLVYKLDGSENRTVLPDSVMTSKAAWTGTQLTITGTATAPGGQTLDQTLVWSLDSEGHLIIEVQLVRPGDSPTKTTMVYRKQ